SLALEHRIPCRAAIAGLPDAAGRGRRVDDVDVVRRDGEVDRAPSRHGRSDVAPLQPREQAGVELRGPPRRRRGTTVARLLRSLRGRADGRESDGTRDGDDEEAASHRSAFPVANFGLDGAFARSYAVR